ncbi:cysteine proteinase precursor [Trifolium repens]|nr:cysteine proteinase precursor [Trifolium repens]
MGYASLLFGLKYVTYRFDQDLTSWFSKRSDQFVNISDLLEKVDWRKLGKVTLVFNQLNCGAFYSSGSVEAVESTNAIKNRRLITLSNQEVVDCELTNCGCDGGSLERSFKYIKDNSLAFDVYYPYIARKKDGEVDKGKLEVYIDDFTYARRGKNEKNCMRIQMLFKGTHGYYT